MKAEPRSIPRVAFASLAFGAVGAAGCGDDPSDAEKLATDACKLIECSDPDTFDNYFSSISDCARDAKPAIQEELDAIRDDYSAACANEYADYQHCYFGEAIDYCRGGDMTVDCDAEYDDYIDACI